MPIPSNTEWRLESARLTLFLTQQASSDADEWWTGVAGVPPDSSIHRRTTGELVDDGAFLEGKLSLVRSNLGRRVDWIFHAVPSVGGEFPGLAPYSAWSSQFQEYMLKWLSNVKLSISRVAVGATMLTPSASREASYEFLSTVLPFIKFEKDWSEFQFQVNKKLQSRTLKSLPDSAKILNCVNRWHAVEVGTVALQVGHPPQTVTHTGNRLELDLSTDVNNISAISMDEVGEVYRELSELAERYSKEGFI